MGVPQILVVDDERVVLSALAAILTHAGYAVLCAGSPAEALEIARRQGQTIDLMVCDVVMPAQNGPSLADDFRLIHPETRYLFIAGLPDHPEVRERILPENRAFLAKPFMPRDLLSKVRHVLQAEKSLGARA